MRDEDQDLEGGVLEDTLNQVSEEIDRDNGLDVHRDVYQDLFDHVPCFITVQDRNYKLLRYNREFSDTFEP